MYPPPPIPFIHGSTTPAVKAVVTAASTAFPPRRRMSVPAAAACGVLAATIPPRPRASSRLTCHSDSTGIARPSSSVAQPLLPDHRRPAFRTELNRQKGLLLFRDCVTLIVPRNCHPLRLEAAAPRMVR